MFAGFIRRQCLYQPFRFQRGAQDELGAVGSERFDGNDNMGKVAISAKYFTDINIVFLALNKPSLLAVVSTLQFKRPGIGNLNARMGNYAKIR